MTFRQLNHWIFVGVLWLGLLATAQASLGIDQSAPLFTGSTENGRKINLADLRGRTVVLEWIKQECPFVKKHYESGNLPNLQKVAVSKGIVWLQVMQQENRKKTKIAVQAIVSPVVDTAQFATRIIDSDGSISKLYGATNTPEFFIIDARGVLVYQGGIDSIPSAEKADIAVAENYLGAALADVSAGLTVSKPITKSYGCLVNHAG